MHPHLIDWLRNVHINPDPKVAARRWEAAVGYSGKIGRESVSKLLHLFLFSSPTPELSKWFTDELLKLDSEFPVTSNQEELRLMAGIVMVSLFEGSSYTADAFALGLRSMTFSNRMTQPVQPEILSISSSYLNSEAEKQRPVDFKDLDPDLQTVLAPPSKAVDEAETSGDATKIQVARSAYSKAVVQAIQERHTFLHQQVRRLAEESAMLWWVLGAYSPLLQARTTELDDLKYALVAACEAADRTHILPPPHSAEALLSRALAPCKKKSKKTTIRDYLATTSDPWRTQYLSKLNYSDSTEIVPFLLGITKVEEFGDAVAAAKILPNLCPGFKVEQVITPEQAANQLYVELMFLKALGALHSN